MFHFCFNDCIPDASNDALVSRLSETLRHFSWIQGQYGDHVSGIITDRLPEKLLLNRSDFSLKDYITHLDRETKRIAFSYFGKYPIDSYFEDLDEEALLTGTYRMLVDGVEKDALNARIVFDNGGVLFTIGIHDCVRKNTLVIKCDGENNCEINNLFGFDENTKYVLELIRKDILSRVGGFEKLVALIGDCSFDSRFRSDFERLTVTAQNFLLKEIDHAINRKAKTRFYPDDKLIKDVTPTSEKEIKIMELRIFSPVALRLYFYEDGNRVFIGSLRGKPGKKEQTSDITNACSVIKELVRLKGKRN